MPPQNRLSFADCLRLLELTAPASVGEIKAAYRRLAHRLHPDRARGDEAARQRFILVAEAYRTLLRAAGAVAQGRKVGQCAACGHFGEVAPALDGAPLCTRCILAPGGGRLLPMPVLLVARCLSAVILIGLAVYLLSLALAADWPYHVLFFATGAFAAGLLSLAALAWSCLSVVHCLTDHERKVMHRYREADARQRSWLHAKWCRSR